MPDVRSDAGVADLLKTLISEAAALARSEVDIVKLEVQESTRAMIIDTMKTAMYGGIALLGAVSLTAFLVVALGQLIGGTNPSGYWVSALIIGAVFVLGGGLMAIRHAQRIGERADLPKTRGEVRNAGDFAREGISRIKRAVDR
ncbi:MAG: phage holin family protein [Acidiferrobacteraceae bacterium]